MSIYTIPYQPIVFGFEHDDCAYCDDETYCQLFEPDDDIFIQFTQTPCGENLICDPRSIHISGDLMTNGDFSSGSSDWNLGIDWSYSAGIVSFIGTGPHGILSQTIATALVPGKYYILKFSISNVTGTLSLVPDLGSAAVVNAVETAGDYVIKILCGAGTDLEFTQAIDACTFDIDNIKLYEISPCWGADTYWIQNIEGGLTHIAGGTSAISVVTPPLTAGVRYRVVITIFNYSAGSVSGRCGTVVGGGASAEGSTTSYIISDGTSFSLVPTTDFEGTVTFIDVKAMNDDYEIVLSNLDQEIDHTPAITTADSYWEEYLTFNFNLGDYQGAYGFADETCFRINVHDDCEEHGDNIVVDGEFINGNDEWDYFSNWFEDFRRIYCLAAYNSTLYQYIVDDNGNDVVQTATMYRYKIDIEGTFPVGTELRIYTGGYLLDTFTGPGSYDDVATIAAPINNLSVGVFFLGDGISTTDRIYVTNLEVYPITEIDEIHISNCIKLAPSHACTKVVQAYAEGDERSWGFEYYNTGFRLSQRIGIIYSHPYYPDEEESYVYSDGMRSISAASSEKYWRAETDYLPEEVHDCLRLQRLSDHFLIDGVEYYVKKGTHDPVWKEQCQTFAPVKFDIRLKTDPSFNRNG